MSNIRKAFDHGKAFIPFITCGDPDLETTAAAVREAVKNGADLIELGIPFSDPTAEGPVIMGADLRALAGGVTTDKIFEFVKTLRKDVTVPLAFMTYANVVFSYGTDRFLANAAEAGIDGLILPDVPYEEKGDFLPACRACAARSPRISGPSWRRPGAIRTSPALWASAFPGPIRRGRWRRQRTASSWARRW